LAARIAARLSLGLTGDAIDLEIDPQGYLVQLKPALGGNVIAPILSKTLPNLVTLRPGMLTPVTPDDRPCVVVDYLPAPVVAETEATVLETHDEAAGDAIALTQAQVVLGVGMGVGGPEHLPTVQALAHTLGATLATTRNVVHAGWLPHHIQVGISGRAIAPRIYLAVGIRGAFNHTVGIQKAGVIIALNQNPRAAIFKAADYGIVGAWQTYLPPLVEALKPVLDRHVS
jgi:electron transfer flavoprotein alpha subunit